MALDESISKSDIEEHSNGLSFVYSKKMAKYMDGVVVDYVKTMFGRRIVIESPHSGHC